LLPRCSEFRRRDIRVRPAFLENRTQVLAEIFQSGTAEEPVAVVHRIYNKARLEGRSHAESWDYERDRCIDDVEIFLHNTPRIGEERPVGADSAAIFISSGDIVGADRNQPAIDNFELTMQLNQQFARRTICDGNRMSEVITRFARAL
jgi:hypothetical protein